jgi:predicted RNA binding protein YcfA (HicA-like mRNA interferase family)
MRLPRDVSGHDLANALGKFGYQISRQTGGHLRLTTGMHGQHHITVPAHRALRAGTLASILGDVARHFEMGRDELLKRLFG